MQGWQWRDLPGLLSNITDKRNSSVSQGTVRDLFDAGAEGPTLEGRPGLGLPDREPRADHVALSPVICLMLGMNAGTSRRALASALQLREPVPIIRYYHPPVCLTPRQLEYLESGFLPEVVQPEFPATSTGCGCRA